ncbi:MAG: LysM peptidoglycan-binding domain-containing protein [Microgenomates group bacterium]|jgi:nucleoid-associated protein YgaU
MPRTKKTTVRKTVKQAAIKNAVAEQSLFQQLQEQLKIDQSYLSLVLGLLIVLIAGILVFNYFKSSKPSLGPSDQISAETQTDVSPENLPGKYTVKDGDTLFLIAQKYYTDGYKYTEIVKANNLPDANTIEEGQVLEIPKIEQAIAEVTITPTIAPSTEKGGDLGTGGAENQTIWGEKINGDTYTVVKGDWLSTIAGRAYGDIMQFNKIAEANNIANPNAIEVGTVLKIPR